MAKHIVHDREEEHDGLISSAALCMRFSLSRNHEVVTDGASTSTQNDDFHPVYTHQIFPGEYIPNYRPILPEPTEQIQQRRELHPSFQNQPTPYGLLIQIRLLPSCAACVVHVTVQLPSSQSCSKNINKKRSINDVLVNDDAREESKLIETIVRTKISPHLPPMQQCTFRYSTTCDGDDTPHTTSSLSTSHNTDEPHAAQKESVVVGKDDAPMPSSLPYLHQPFGTILREYTTNHPNTHTTNFCISICPGVDCSEYFSAIQTLSYYYIENASLVNIRDPDWKVLFIFCQHTTSTTATALSSSSSATRGFSLVGYMTLFHFQNPYRKPIGGTIVRICQVLILPPYQRQKHGQQMLHALYQYCSNNDNDTDTTTNTTVAEHNIVEINVEDPAPAFTYLRILVDYERFRNHFPDGFAMPHPNSVRTLTIQDEAFFKPLTDVKIISHFQLVLKTTVLQIQILYEIDKLRQLQQHTKGLTDGDDQIAPLTKRYRLMVKQRLYEQNKESIDEQLKKQQLESMYQKVQTQYERILSKTINPCL